MILTDTLLELKHLMDIDWKDKFSSRQKKDIKDLITYLTVNNIWTVEDLKNKLK